MFCCGKISDKIKGKLRFWNDTNVPQLNCKNHNEDSKESLTKSTKFSAEDLATFSELFQKHKQIQDHKDDHQTHYHEYIKKGEFGEIMSYLS